ncbi:MAG: cytochrome c [Hyphomicrobiaceae bacterium]|nr:cytochrome c [Hyphomicrobiaceae bacterium]
MCSVALVAVLMAVLLWWWPINPPAQTNFPPGDVNRGAYLARMAGCIACHTDIKGNGKPLAGGAPIATQFGTFHPPNLTTDSRFGIGSWTLPQFATALRAGVSPSGKPYYPAFPYPFYGALSDQDVADLWAAFKTVAPVEQPSPQQDLSFPFNMRFGLKLWRTLFIKPSRSTESADKSTRWNRGAQIVNGPAHCGACHTPRNLLGARIETRKFEGASNLPGGGTSPAITAAALKKAGWKSSDITHALRYGLTPKGDSLGGSMGEVVSEGTRYLSDDDLNAIATYLLDEPTK